MDAYRVLALVDFIHLLHRGEVDKPIFLYFQQDTENCTAREANLAIENLMTRWSDVDAVEMTIAKFIRSVAPGLNSQTLPDYGGGGIFPVLNRENGAIERMLGSLKESYRDKLPLMKRGDSRAAGQFRSDLEGLESLAVHYRKLQYGLFSALESAGAPARCIKLMWHLEDRVMVQLKICREILNGESPDYDEFNRIYGQMYFTAASLPFREEKILYPEAWRILPGTVQLELVKETDSHGILS